MKTIKIYFDEAHKNPFIDYAMETARGLTEHNTHILDYFRVEEVSKIANYFIKKHNTCCNNKGEYWELGELHTSTPTHIYIIASGETITDRCEILEHEQKAFTEDGNAYIEDNLYNDLFCEIERLLRLEHGQNLSYYDKRFLQRARA